MRDRQAPEPEHDGQHQRALDGAVEERQADQADRSDDGRDRDQDRVGREVERRGPPRLVPRHQVGDPRGVAPSRLGPADERGRVPRALDVLVERRREPREHQQR